MLGVEIKCDALYRMIAQQCHDRYYLNSSPREAEVSENNF